jgi:hypothetical protein
VTVVLSDKTTDPLDALPAPIAEELLRGRIALRDRALAEKEQDRWCSDSRRAAAARSWNLLTHKTTTALGELLPFAEGRDLDRPPWFSEMTAAYWGRRPVSRRG